MDRLTFPKFLAVGGLAAVVNIVSRISFNHFMPYAVAVVPAYLCGMVTAFVLNRHFVFSHASRHEAHVQGLRFVLVNGVALAQVWAVGVGLADWVFPRIHFVWHAHTVAHVIAVASPTVFSYFAHKHFSFAADRR